MLNLDTHILIHAFHGSLTSREREILEGDEWSISAIVPWGLAKLVQLGRIDMDLESPEVVRAPARIRTWIHESKQVPMADGSRASRSPARISPRIDRT